MFYFELHHFCLFNKTVSKLGISERKLSLFFYLNYLYRRSDVEVGPPVISLYFLQTCAGCAGETTPRVSGETILNQKCHAAFSRSKYPQRKADQQVKVLIKNLAIFFLFPSKEFLPISFKIQLLETSSQKQKEQRQKC